MLLHILKSCYLSYSYHIGIYNFSVFIESEWSPCNNCSCVLPNFEYLCLNKFCNWSHVASPKGSRDWYHNLVSPNSKRQNLCTFISSSKQWAFIQSFECNKCASASSSGFPENSGLKFDQFKCRCLCLAASWCWGWSCPCLWLGVAAPYSWFAIVLLYNLYVLHSLFLQFSSFLSIPNMINLLG